MSQNSNLANFETVAEVKIDTNAFSAQYGVGGVIYNQITKGGTSQFHGAGYEYFQNNDLNAAPYSFGAGTAARVPPLRNNNFGFLVGGPILKHKMFFFFNFDKDLNFGGQANGFETVPTALMRMGDFTGQPTLYDPTTQTVDANGIVHRVSFADEYHNGNKIPANLLDPVAQAIQAYYPQANIPGTVVNGVTSNNFFFNAPSYGQTRKYFGRLDYDVTHNNRITISDLDVDGTYPILNEGNCPINCLHVDSADQNAQISDVWAINPNLTNEARIGFTDQFIYETPYTLNGNYPAKLGLKFAKANIFPNITITGACCNNLQSGTNVSYQQEVLDPSDVVTLIRGRHVLHFGGEVLINRVDSEPWGNIDAGSFQFTGVYTAASQGTSSTTGVPYADFLLGQAQSWSAHSQPEYGGRLKLPQAFIQDDIKVRPNLTVNLGLRFQGMTGWSDVHGDDQAFDPAIFNPAANRYGAIWYGVTKAHGRTTLQAPVWTTFLPRFGFSYQPKSNTIVRGGVGLFAYTWSEDTYGNGLGYYLGSSGNNTDQTNGVNPVVLLNSDGNTNYQGPGGASVNALYIPASTDPSAHNGQGVGYNQYHTPVPKILQYNLEIQRELGPNMVVNVAYVGSNAFNLAFPVDINQVPEDKLSPTDTAPGTNARPYPQYQGITGSTNNARSNYNSLQTSVQRRMVSGLEFDFNYTWSHFMDDQDSSGWNGQAGSQPYQNAYVPSANYGPSNYDIRNSFKGRAVYELPVGKGRRFLNDNYVLDQVLGGWEAAATAIAQTGNPFTATMLNNLSYSQAGNQYPNVVGNPNSGPHTNQEWFNVADFAAPAPGTFGDSHRNSLRGPGLTELNLSLGKNFSVWRQVVVQVRANATNVLNHPSFAIPNSQIGSSQAGQITGVTVGGRTMQLYGRISF